MRGARRRRRSAEILISRSHPAPRALLIRRALMESLLLPPPTRGRVLLSRARATESGHRTVWHCTNRERREGSAPPRIFKPFQRCAQCPHATPRARFTGAPCRRSRAHPAERNSSWPPAPARCNVFGRTVRHTAVLHPRGCRPRPGPLATTPPRPRFSNRSQRDRACQLLPPIRYCTVLYPKGTVKVLQYCTAYRTIALYSTARYSAVQCRTVPYRTEGAIALAALCATTLSPARML